MGILTIGRYEVLKELGQGGMAVVYLAYDPVVKRQVAIKLLPRQFTFDPQFRGRFQREAEAIAALEHPAIVPVYDYGEHEEQPFIVMRYMPGGSLAGRMASQSLTFPEIAALVRRIAPALDAAHQRGMVHRDLKPGNILFDQWGEAYLSDFGIVKMTETAGTFTGTGIVGTPAYMSPEQAGGTGEIDGRSDIYSLAVMIFELLTRRLPYTADTPVRLAVAHIIEPVPNVLDVNPGLPPQTGPILSRALAKRPQERFQTVSELANNFSSLVSLPMLPITGAGPMTVARMPSRKSLLIPTSTTGRVILSALLIVMALFTISAVLLGAVFAAGYILATPTATATLSPTPTATSTITPSPTPTHTASATPTATLTWTPTATETPTATATRVRVILPTATLGPTPFPACPEGEFFDPLMNRCRRPDGPGGGGGGGPAPTLTCEQIYYPDPCA
jgi:serine/threonine-protein kinase